MRFWIHTYGCQMNVRDSEAVEALMVAAGHVKATGDLVITDGARIEIDATDMSANAPLYTRLATAANVVGEFAADKVSFSYDETNAAMRTMFASAEIVYERDGEKGLWLKTTPRGTMMIFR